MSAKHRMPQPQKRPPLMGPTARRRLSGSGVLCGVLSASMLCAASLTALFEYAVGPDKPTVQAIPVEAPPRAPQGVNQEGTLIAVSADSVTARSADGYTQTYVVTPNTTVITHRGSQPASATTHFTVNDHVRIVGTIQGGTALATAVADREASRGDGPPMDYGDGQSVGPAPGITG